MKNFRRLVELRLRRLEIGGAYPLFITFATTGRGACTQRRPAEVCTVDWNGFGDDGRRVWRARRVIGLEVIEVNAIGDRRGGRATNPA